METERDLTDDARRDAVALAASEQRAHHEARILSANLMMERGVSQCEAGECGRGLLWLARALETAPDDEGRLKRSARLLIGGWSRQLRKPLAVFPHDTDVETAALSRDGRLFAAAPGNRIYLWRIDGRKLHEQPFVHEQLVTTLAFSPTPPLVSASRDGTARLWDIATGRQRGEPLRHEGSVAVAVFSPDGKSVLSAGADCPPACGTRLRRNSSASRFDTARPSWPRYLAPTASRSPRAAKTAPLGLGRSYRSGRIDRLAHEGAVGTLVFSPDSRILATGSVDKDARLWDAETGHLLHRLSEHTGQIRAIAFSPDGRTLATGSDDRKAILWDVALGTPRARLHHQESIRHIVFSPGGKAPATGSTDYTARLWAADNGRPLGAPLPHQGDVNMTAFGPGGNTLLTASDDGMVRLWPTEPPGVAAAVVSLGPAIHNLSSAWTTASWRATRTVRPI